MKLLYLHGFRSSPESLNAQKCFAHVQQLIKKGDRLEWYCPQLPPSPKEAMEMVMAHIEGWQGHQMVVIGSSLGGFYANYVAEHKRCGAVLLNPAVNPVRSLEKAIAEQESPLPDDEYFLQPAFVSELEVLAVPVTMPERYFLIAAKGDELLDYREAVKRYKGCEQLILEESDHRITDFDNYIGDVFEFIGLGE
ncbi:MAG: YqiA/YcfP family alpha/beta fold hydrolase [Saezia sp.]